MSPYISPSPYLLSLIGYLAQNRSTKTQQIMKFSLTILLFLAVVGASLLLQLFYLFRRQTTCISPLSTQGSPHNPSFTSNERRLNVSVSPSAAVAMDHDDDYDDISAQLSHCQFRMFPFSTKESGLPWLFDAFADHTHQLATFIGVHRREIYPEYSDSDSIFTTRKPKREAHHFLCMFHKGTDGSNANTSIPVFSAASHPPGFANPAFPMAYERNFIIQCRIPSQLQSLVVAGQRETRLHVDLVAIEHPLYPETVADSKVLTELPRIPNIPICFPTSNADQNVVNFQAGQFNIIAHTQVRTTYSVSKRETVSEAYRLEEWIHFHRYQGVDHFVIYDNDIQDHGPLESLLRPYVEQGLVTRVWNPMNETIPKGSPSGKIKRHMQASMSNAALHRYGFSTKYMINPDMDEFLMPQNSSKTVLFLLRKTFRKRPQLDGIKWAPYVITYCNGTILPKSELGGHSLTSQRFEHSELDSKRCKTTLRLKAEKLAIKTNRILLWMTHDAFLNTDWERPEMYTLRAKIGYLAHYRRDSYSTIDLPGDKVVIINENELPKGTDMEPIVGKYLEARQKELEQANDSVA